MKHLTRQEISRLVGIKYKGSKNKDDLVFLNQSMNHLLICPTCLKQFKDKTNMLINGLNYKVEKVKYKEICIGILEQGSLIIKSLNDKIHCVIESYQHGIDFGSSYSMMRNDLQIIPDYVLDYKDGCLIVITFEENEVVIKQDDLIIHYSSKNKDEITYEYQYIFDHIDIHKEFKVLIIE